MNRSKCRDLKLEDGTKTDPKLEDAVAASTVPIAAFQLSGRYCMYIFVYTDNLIRMHVHVCVYVHIYIYI